VKFGLEICKPDLVVSGVNKGANSGRNVFYSGTIGACVEATFKEVPSIAFSSINEEHPNFALCKPYIPLIVAHFMTHPIPKGVMINVNFPSTIIKGIKYASQGQGYWKEDFSKTRIQKPKATFSFGAQWSHAKESLESDVYYLSQGFITAVPIRVDNLTDHAHQSQHKKTFESLNTHPLFQE
jgi:5'-nucleotidase